MVRRTSSQPDMVSLEKFADTYITYWYQYCTYSLIGVILLEFFYPHIKGLLPRELSLQNYYTSEQSIPITEYPRNTMSHEGKTPINTTNIWTE